VPHPCAVLCARVGFHGGVPLGIFPLDESHKLVILSEVAAPRSEAAAQSKDPYTPETIREASRRSPHDPGVCTEG
jgi:hypothetical protein